MTALLEFFSVSWGDLDAAIGSRDRKVLRKIVEEFEHHVAEYFPPNAFGSGPDFAEGLERWIEGQVPKGKVVLLGDALAFQALAKHFGAFVGSLGYAVGTGDKFHKDFLGLATRLLRPSFPLSYLLWRPILGYEPTGDAFWGGLSAAELASISSPLSRDPPDDPDEDHDQWLVDLWNALGGATDAGRDLVTIYS